MPVSERHTMFGFYLASAIIGWAFVGLFLFGGFDSDVDGDLDTGSEADLSEDGPTGGTTQGLASAAVSLLSFRSIVFFLAFFGVTGIVLNLIDAGAAATLVAGIVVGVFAWVFNSFVFRALKLSDVSSTLRETDLHGAMGEVVLPISPGHRGRISIEAGEQLRYLTAEPFDATTHRRFGAGDAIVVVEFDEGTAKVAPIEILDSQADGS